VLHFKMREDAARARLPALHKRAVLACIDEYEGELRKLGAAWDPDLEGYFTFLDETEADEPMSELGWSERLRDLLVEATHFHAAERLWQVVYCPSNGWAWTAFVPDGPALSREVREWLLANASDADAALARRGAP